MKTNTIQQIQRAILNHEKTFRNITLPKAQFGSSKQKEAYFFLQATKFFKLHFSNQLNIKKEKKEQLFQRMLNNFETP